MLSQSTLVYELCKLQEIIIVTRVVYESNYSNNCLNCFKYNIFGFKKFLRIFCEYIRKENLNYKSKNTEINFLTPSLPGTHCVDPNTHLPWNSNISKTVKVNIIFKTMFYKEYSISFLMICRLTCTFCTCDSLFIDV